MLDEVYEYFIDHKVMRLESTVDKEWLAHAILAYPGRTTLLVDFMCDIDAEYIFDEPGCSRYRVSRSYKTPLLIPYGTIIVKAGKDYAYFNWEDFKEYANKMKLILREENEMEKEVKEVVDNMVEETMKKMCEKQKCSDAPRYYGRKDVLSDAETCVCGHREQDYGSPENNFQIIADLWNAYLGSERLRIQISAHDVAMLMALLKVARIRNNGGTYDSYVDLAGYAACAGEIGNFLKK